MLSAARTTHRVLCILEPWGIFGAIAALLFTFVAIMIDLERRQSERTFQAWQVLRALQNDRLGTGPPLRVIGSYPREALEFLNREFVGYWCHDWVERLSIKLTGNDRRRCVFPAKTRESLAGLVAPGTELLTVNLFRANLEQADLSEANLAQAYLVDADFVQADLSRASLYNANLTRTDLSIANLEGASLVGADLTDAVMPGANLAHACLIAADLSDTILSFANFSGASLYSADLRNAQLVGTDLSEADLAEVHNLEQFQLDGACGSAPPRNIPSGLTWRPLQSCREDGSSARTLFDLPPVDLENLTACQGAGGVSPQPRP